MNEKDRSDTQKQGTSRRQFIKQCGVAVVTAAAYQAISVILPRVVEATTSSEPICTLSCVSNADQTVPPVNPPKCVCISGCINSCTSGCEVSCTGCISSSTTVKS